jgi:hypothetical protein
MSEKYPPLRIEINDKLIFNDLVENIKVAIERILNSNNPDFEGIKDKIIDIAAKEYTNYEHTKYYLSQILEQCLSEYLFKILMNEDADYAKKIKEKIASNSWKEAELKIAAYVDWKIEKLLKVRVDEQFNKIKKIMSE